MKNRPKSLKKRIYIKTGSMSLEMLLSSKKNHHSSFKQRTIFVSGDLVTRFTDNSIQTRACMQ